MSILQSRIAAIRKANVWRILFSIFYFKKRSGGRGEESERKVAVVKKRRECELFC
jgi:hypothetical protein